ncbi:D-2-hydroxyacid dehydrogenase [Pseudonocardia sp. RS11V-5]|uniref:D-2-hydroxyacid dehydrogenase n=1 Tax=Pseudonocardia terrae TaxID=2905831 RepID=UPI001E5B0F1B|nr:D-2-hydroxyacid dehydrogenase [Pseudonocardia terrae]MCE3550946.1 D-2-hydroxyacid dehydrogenase [Pseudonocardia terrae]
MPPSPDRLRVVASTPLEEDLVAEIVRAEPRVDIVRDGSLLPPQRFAGDHSGDPAFRRTPAQQRAFEELVDSADALYGVPDEQPAALARTVRANPGLRWVHTMPAGGGSQVKAAGLTREELDRVAFSTSAGVHAQPLAEYALFGLLAGAKSLPRLLDQQRRAEWSGRWAMGLLAQQRILLVGLGSIGRATAEKLKALGATVLGTSRSTDRVEHVDEVVHPDRLAEVVPAVDGIVVSLPGTAATEGLVSAEVLTAVTPGTTLVSVGRGTVIDEQALAAALGDGRIGFAALDVFAAEPLAADSPLWRLPNVLVSPHTAALNPAEDRLIAQLFARNATRLLDGRELINRVDTVEFY